MKKEFSHKLKTLKVIIYNYTYPFVLSIPLLCIRRMYLRAFLKKLGKNTYIGRCVDVRSPLLIEIGDNCVINGRSVLDGRGGLIIGSDVDIAENVYIWTAQHDQNDNNHSMVTAPVIIHDHVWIASRATLLPGVELHRGCVVASCALVTKSFDELCVVGGVPAKIISKRHNLLNYKLNYHPWFIF